MAGSLRVAVSNLESGERVLDEAASRYVLRVHRLRAGDELVLFDPDAALEADAVIVSVDARRARCRLSQPRSAARRGELPVVLLQALGKGDKPEDVIRAATALGVRRVVLVETERSVVRLAERAAGRRDRWREVAAQAARQSGRGDVPAIDGPLSLAAALESAEAELRIVLAPDAEQPLLDLVSAAPRDAVLAVLIGPEGGFSDVELALAEAHGFRRARLGPLVLRTEVAATAVVGALLAQHDLRGL